MTKWSEAIRITLAAMIITIVLVAVIVFSMKSDLSFQVSADFIIRIAPIKKPDKDPKMTDWMTLP